jgi:hypothetical protein
MRSIKGNHLRVALLSIFLISMCLLTVAAGYSYQESPKTRSAPISKQDILDALTEKDEEKKLSPEMLLCQVKRSGVNFRLTPAEEEDWRAKRVNEDLINEIKNSYLTPRRATTSDDLCLICRDKLQPISIFRLDDPEQEVTALKIASKLERMGCEVKVDSPSWLQENPSRPVRRLVPPIIKYPPLHNDAKDYAKAIADFIKNEANIVLKPESHPSLLKAQRDKKLLEVWLLEKRP